MDDEGREVRDGEVGELTCRGPYTLRGYFGVPEYNARQFTPDGFYCSGDLMRKHPSGNYVVEGRKKDLINRGGEKISAEEIENLILSHPAVTNVACVPYPDERLGERMCACVILKPSAKLALEDKTGFVPCTPAGSMRLLAAAGVKTAGAEAVVIGRSMIVGKPMALLLMAKGSDATVTVAHSRSKDLAAICRRADIIVAAVGRPEMVKADWVKEGAVVIDVGINRIDDATKKSGYRLVGDVAYDEVAPKCAAITPVPGGVGPMTIAMLMKNTLQAARQLG